MPEIKWKQIGETVGLLVVVASLIFVGFQLRQDQVIARSELASNGFNRMTDISRTLVQPEFAAIYAKMLKEPETLSTTEMIQLNAFLTQVSDLMGRECYLVNRGVYVECDNMIRDSIRRYFGNAYAQAWWKVTDTRPNVKLPDWVDDEIFNVSTQAEVLRLELIQKNFSREK